MGMSMLKTGKDKKGRDTYARGTIMKASDAAADKLFIVLANVVAASDSNPATLSNSSLGAINSSTTTIV